MIDYASILEKTNQKENYQEVEQGQSHNKVYGTPKGAYCDLVWYIDSDFGGYRLDTKIISGTCHLLDNLLVYWNRKK